ncbi:MAG: hypothetical protein JRJ12_10135, partial [Deltaproteobacteria bacterium]|nr:hypothetical protein [Deltaproteobacteria bacterium]MBW2071721.1 hypothetical protein [Deltaproteobacteria bacterium]
GLNHQKSGIKANIAQKTDRIDLDATWYKLDNLMLRGGYRYESIDNEKYVKGRDRNNSIFWFSVEYSF